MEQFEKQIGKHIYILGNLETATPRRSHLGILFFNIGIFIGNKKTMGKEITICSTRRPKGKSERRFVFFEII